LNDGKEKLVVKSSAVMRVLVTGNKGYIGAVLCGKLLQEGFEVVGLDTGFYIGCNLFEPEYNIKQIFKDVRSVGKEDLLGFDAVIHLAALSNDPIGALNPQLTADINYLASARLAEIAKEAGVKKFIFSSSCSVYGIAGDEMIDEVGMVSPATAYARSKVESEEKIAELADEVFSPVFLRNATVYGVSSMLRVDLVVNNLATWAYTTGKIQIMSDGSPWRPLIHIQDICGAFMAVLKAPRKLIHNQIFHVGQNSENYRVRDVADAVKKVMPECDIEYTGEHGADTRTYKVNFTKIVKILGDYFHPTWDIEKGIRELLEAYRASNFSLTDFQSEKFTRLKRIKKLLNESKVDEYLFWREPNEGGKRK